MKKWGWLLVALVAGVIRLLALGEIPVHLTQDEVAVGYEAYSILKTGKDEWGASWPLQFRSVGDYKQPVGIYMISLAEAVFGVNEWSVRLPAVLMGVLAAVLMYLLARRFVFKEWWGAMAVGMLWAISGWEIFFSRYGFDGTVALTMVIGYVYLWLAFMERPSWIKWWGVIICGALAVATYHATKVFVPLLALVMLLAFRERWWGWLWKQKRKVRMINLGGGLVLAAVMVRNFVLGVAATRGAMTFISKDFDFARVLAPNVEGFMGLAGKVILLIEFWWSRYVDYFGASFFVGESLELTIKNQPGAGILYGVELLFLVLGLVTLFSRRVEKYVRDVKLVRWLVMGVWLVGILPASLANNPRHPSRSMLASPAIYLVIGLGIVTLVEWLRKQKILIKVLVMGVVMGGFAVGMVRFSDYYLVHYRVQLSEFRQYPWGEVAKYVNGIRGGYARVVVDPRFGTQGPVNVGIPQYYFLFYGRKDPYEYQRRDLRTGDSFNYENLEFGGFDWQNEDRKGVLYVASPWSFATKDFDKGRVMKSFSFGNGVEGVWVVEGGK